MNLEDKVYLKLGHVSEDGEDQHAGQQAGARVHDTRDNCISEANRFTNT